MHPTILTCPHCGAPLAVTRFASLVVCRYCEATVRVDPSAVSASKYRRAWEEWNEPSSSDDALRFSMAGTHWIGRRLLAQGEISDVYLATRARWPTELALLKVVRESRDATLLEHEWHVLQQLHAATDIDLGRRVPAPVAIGRLDDGRLACAYRWASGFLHTFETVRAAYPGGVPPVSSIWVWRRILEVIAVLRRKGLVHGAILPNHLLVENGEHGVRIVGFSCADAPGAPLRAVSTDFEDWYPASVLETGRLTAASDLVMSARCVSYLLAPAADVPPRLSALLQRIGSDAEHADVDPWNLRKELGELGRALFGPPAFHPLEMATV